MGLSSGSEERVFAAEKNVAVVRLAVIVFNVAAYWWLLYPMGVPWLAAGVSAVALAYGFYVIVGQPYRAFPVLLTSVWTATTDGLLIILWIHATGDYASPFHLLWYLSLMAVTFRYDWRAIATTSVLYAVAYLGLLQVTGTLQGHGAEAGIRATYILLMGLLGALLAHESLLLFEDRFQLRQRMQRLEMDRLVEVDRFKTEFINSAAHELNTPLTPLLLQIHNLRTQIDATDNRRRIVDVLDRNLRRLSRLVQDMLDVARLQSGRLHIDAHPVDLSAVLAETVETFRAVAQERGIALEVRTAGPVQATADAHRIGQVVYNLVSNAIKFTPAGGQVTVEGHAEDGHATLTVQDTGVGLTAAQASQMFQPFSRPHRQQVESPGTGLGLYISRGIMEGHGGTLECSSPGTGQGATFTARLPLQPAAAAGPTQPAPQT